MRSHLQVLGRCNKMLCLSCWAGHTFLVMLLARGAGRGDADKQDMHCSASGHCCRAVLRAQKAECLLLIVPGVWCVLQTHAGGVRAAKAEWLRRCGAARDLPPLDMRWELTADKLLAGAREQAGSALLAGAAQQCSGSADAAELGKAPFVGSCMLRLRAGWRSETNAHRLEARLH